MSNLSQYTEQNARAWDEIAADAFLGPSSSLLAVLLCLSVILRRLGM
ncbi:hypothetical protein KFU94_05650 [Chloroflexi bacterium TSY]|nr:hypothetical protein [Chloroflexi bacterium TSY]